MPPMDNTNTYTVNFIMCFALHMPNK